MMSSEEFDVDAIKLISEKEFNELSYDAQMLELRRMEIIVDKLENVMKEKMKEKETVNSAFINAQKEYDTCVANCKELTEREELINFIEDNLPTGKVVDNNNDALSVDSSQSDCSLFPHGIVTTHNKKISNIRRLGTAGNLQFFLGSLPDINDTVFIKLYIDPSFYYSDDSASTGSHDSANYPVSPDDDVCNDLRREVLVIRGLVHDHIVLYYQEIKQRGVYGYAMEYCKQGNLHDYIMKHGALDENTIRIVMKQMLEALSYLAEQRIVHRDIKTANILIAAENCYKLCDFGSCYAIEKSARTTIVDDGSMRGTDVYIAPETGRGMQRGRSDVWSLGCCLHEMITGDIPWGSIRNESKTRESVIYRISRAESAPPMKTETWNQMSKDLQDLYSLCFDLVSEENLIDCRMRIQGLRLHSC